MYFLLHMEEYIFKASLIRVCFLLYPVSQWLHENTHFDFLYKLYLIRLYLIGHLNTADIQILVTRRCFRYLQVSWSRVTLTDDMEHVSPLSFKGHVSAWTESDLKFIDPQDTHQEHVIQGSKSSYGFEAKQYKWSY